MYTEYVSQPSVESKVSLQLADSIPTALLQEDTSMQRILSPITQPLGLFYYCLQPAQRGRWYFWFTAPIQVLNKVISPPPTPTALASEPGSLKVTDLYT